MEGVQYCGISEGDKSLSPFQYMATLQYVKHIAVYHFEKPSTNHIKLYCKTSNTHNTLGGNIARWIKELLIDRKQIMVASGDKSVKEM